MGPYDFWKDTAFDLNHDGEIDSSEWAFINETVFSEDSVSDIDDDDDDELDDDLLDDVEDMLKDNDEFGLTMDELEMMDEDERRDALEDAGFDVDDFE